MYIEYLTNLIIINILRDKIWKLISLQRDIFAQITRAF